MESKSRHKAPFLDIYEGFFESICLGGWSKHTELYYGSEAVAHSFIQSQPQGKGRLVSYQDLISPMHQHE